MPPMSSATGKPSGRSTVGIGAPRSSATVSGAGSSSRNQASEYVVIAEGDLVRHRAPQAAGPVAVHVAGVEEHLLVGRRRAVERVRREVGPAVVDDGELEVLDLELRLVRG